MRGSHTFGVPPVRECCPAAGPGPFLPAEPGGRAQGRGRPRGQRGGRQLPAGWALRSHSKLGEKDGNPAWGRAFSRAATGGHCEPGSAAGFGGGHRAPALPARSPAAGPAGKGGRRNEAVSPALLRCLRVRLVEIKERNKAAPVRSVGTSAMVGRAGVQSCRPRWKTVGIVSWRLSASRPCLSAPVRPWRQPRWGNLELFFPSF